LEPFGLMLGDTHGSLTLPMQKKVLYIITVESRGGCRCRELFAKRVGCFENLSSHQSPPFSWTCQFRRLCPLVTDSRITITHPVFFFFFFFFYFFFKITMLYINACSDAVRPRLHNTFRVLTEKKKKKIAKGADAFKKGCLPDTDHGGQ